MIRGWDVGFANMTVGECATLTVRYDYGYGEQGMPSSRMPPKATLVFEVELLAAKEMSDDELAEVDAKVAALRPR